MITRSRFLRRLGCIVGIAATLVLTMNTRLEAKDCHRYKKGTWYVDLGTKVIERVGLDKDSETLCAPLPKSGQENVKLVILRGKHIVFERQLYVNVSFSFDYEDEESGGLKGGTVPPSSIVISSLIPAGLGTRNKKFVIRLIKLDDGSLLGQGQL